jgi:PIN domain nuclease of toxin-antitoxin system
MRYLLDTHAFIWLLFDSRQIAPNAMRVLLKPENTFVFSAVSISEIAIKHRLQKPTSPPFGGAEAADLGIASGCLPLDYTPQHAVLLDTLPNHHRDPFDRMLIAQAVHEGLVVITRDEEFDAYGIPLLRC